MEHLLGILPVVELCLVEFVVLFGLDVLPVFLPERNHGVECFLFLGFDGLLVVGRIRDGLGDHHLDRIADIVAVLLDEFADLVFFKIFRVLHIIGIILEIEGDAGAGFGFVAFGDGVAVVAFRLPAVGGVTVDGTGFDRNLLCDHEGAVEADTKLADDVDIGVGGLVELFLEVGGAALGDGAEVLFEFVLVHADAAIFNDELARILIAFDPDPEIVFVDAFGIIGQREIPALVEGVGRIGNEFAQEDFLICVDGVDHQIEQSFGFCFKLFLCHIAS